MSRTKSFIGAAAALAVAFGTLGVGATASAAGVAKDPVYCAGNAATGESACAYNASDIAAVQRQLNVGAHADPTARSTAAADVLVGRLYVDAQFGGFAYEIYWTQLCNTGAAVDWSFGNLPASIDNKTTSFRGYASCKLKIWENQFSGASLGPLSSSGNVSAMNDVTSSVQGF